MRLTVAIPTYNRNAILKTTLEHMLPQLDDQCKLLIVDNHSDVPVEETLRDLLAAYPRLNYQIVRNRANIGGAANILRCFELCETEWMWLFGDDDHPAADGVSTVLRHVDSSPDCCFFNFASPRFSRPGPKTVRGIRQFVRELDNWSNLLYMSVGVYHVPAVRPQLRFGYHFAYSLSPHVAILLASLGEHASCCFSDECILEYAAPGGWILVNALLGKMTLLELPMDEDVRWELAEKLREKPSLEAVAMYLLMSARKQKSWREAVYQYDQICSRVYYRDPALIRRFRAMAYRLLIRFYAIGYPAAITLFSLLKKFPGFTRAEPAKFPTGNRYGRV
jgi:glycosyltransferase involved in cell wall biosynthesis